ncbi:hypothetical protein BOX15_Mlig011275g2 [Macrostomum lignano]|nr:hypothetical protein BOX15_Mlig011275g2 [Macrostomum lignano]
MQHLATCGRPLLDKGWRGSTVPPRQLTLAPLVLALLLALLLVAPAPAAAFRVAGLSDSAAIEKRQLVKPQMPERFNSEEELKIYMQQLEAYYKLLARQRFGKRSDPEVWQDVDRDALYY